MQTLVLLQRTDSNNTTSNSSRYHTRSNILIELKRYQTQTVAEFDDYLKRIRTYKEVKPHASVFNHIQSKKHHTKLYNERDINSPYICIRIPTGGGKNTSGMSFAKFTVSRVSAL